jgi:isoleucyl-tRNA synthetase
VLPELTYLKVQDEESGRTLIVGETRVEAVLKHGFKVLERLKGTELLGL